MVVGNSIAISNVVVAEANAPKNGILETTDSLFVITWTINTPDTITGKSLTIDGKTVSPIYGPFGNSYAAQFGPLGAGTHNYDIQATDSKGDVADSAGTFNVVAAAALMVEASTLPSDNAQPLSAAQLPPIVAEAEHRLSGATGTDVAAALSGVLVQVADLPANMLGEASGSTIYVSPNAAGYGWFVDPTPSDDGEFTDVLGPYALAAANGSPAADRADLLTTVMHEMGHLLG